MPKPALATGRETSTAWPFPFADGNQGRLGRKRWILLIGIFLLLHYGALAISPLTGNFDPYPNHDHVWVMRDVLEHGSPQVAIWPPGFGYYMALKWKITESLGWPYWSGKLFLDVFLMLGAGFLATLLGQSLTRSRWLAMAAGLGQVGAPIFLLTSAEDLAVLLFQPIFLLSLLLLVRELQRRQGPRIIGCLAAGGVTGLACLVRGNPQFLVLFWAPLSLWILRRGRVNRPLGRSVAVLLAFVVAEVAVLAPWVLHQRRLGKDGVFSAPVVYYAFLDGMKRHRGHPLSDWLQQHYDEIEHSMASVVELNLKWLHEEPLNLASLYVIKFVKSWYLSDSGRWDHAIVLFHAPLWIGALIGIGTWMRRRPLDPALLFCLVVIAYMWTVSALLSGLARYSGPVYGIIGVLAGLGAMRVAPLWRRLRAGPGSAR